MRADKIHLPINIAQRRIKDGMGAGDIASARPGRPQGESANSGTSHLDIPLLVVRPFTWLSSWMPGHYDGTSAIWGWPLILGLFQAACERSQIVVMVAGLEARRMDYGPVAHHVVTVSLIAPS
ncbi:TLC domain-containing protein [Apiospora aurea]|uniref:TLC domain-containing protein n=1 Tax=Apiospora aurea TaxID=335848 RepID=A0ABR1QKF1_9PEZI